MNKIFGMEIETSTANTLLNVLSIVALLYLLQNLNIFNAWEFVSGGLKNTKTATK